MVMSVMMNGYSETLLNYRSSSPGVLKRKFLLFISKFFHPNHSITHVHILQVKAKITEYLSLICIWIATIVICHVLQRMPLHEYNSGWVFCNCSQTNVKQFFLSLHPFREDVYKHCICYLNVPTTGTKDPLFQQSLNLWLAHKWQ